MPDQLFGQTSIPILLGEPNPVDEWQPVFVDKSQPVNDRAAYPPFAEVRANYVQLRESNLKLLQSLSEADLDKPTKAPPKGLEHEFDTYGRSFLTLALHQMLHRANVTDARRAAGPDGSRRSWSPARLPQGTR
jgi:hypothetical protein